MPAPPLSAYGWMSELVGSCFAWRSRNGVFRRRECFSFENGFLVQTSHQGVPQNEISHACRYEPIGSEQGLFLLSCHGPAQFTKLAKIEGSRVTIRFRDDRSAVSHPWLDGGMILDRAEPDRLQLSHEGNLASAAGMPIILSRISD